MKSFLVWMTLAGAAFAQAPAKKLVVLKAARMLDVRAGRTVAPGLVVIQGNRIVSVGAALRQVPRSSTWAM